MAHSPALPVELLAELLLRPETAGSAAMNPTLPADVMHRMLDAAEALWQAEAAAEPGAKAATEVARS